MPAIAIITRCALTILTLHALLACQGCGRNMKQADLVITNARIWTTHAPSETPEKQPDPTTNTDTNADPTAFAIRDGRFAFVGNDDDAKAWIGPHTKIINAAGARIIPGITDAHLHLVSGGQQLARLNLRDAPSRAAFVTAIAERGKQLQPGEWIRGGRWSTESWNNTTQPDKAWIDPATREYPVFLVRMDGHSALANSAALRIAGIDRNGPDDPVGGRIVRDPKTGEPTGLLKESALELVRDRIPEASAKNLDTALAAAQLEAHRHGLTCVHTMSEWSDLAPLLRARNAGSLSLRVRVHVMEDDWTELIENCQQFPNDPRLKIAGFKQFMDGSLGSRTAYMTDPFSDNPPGRADYRGLLTAIGQNENQLQRMCVTADAARLNLAIHAIGDQANHRVLNIYENAIKKNGPRSARRMRIEHAQHLLPEDIERFGRLGIVASMQPLHKADDARYAEKAIGPERCKSSYAFRSLLDTGAPLAFGSDWPVVSLNPFLGIHAAVTGMSVENRPFVPEQNISISEALAAYTTGGAYAVAEEKSLGRIAVGYFADFVILDRDILAIPPTEISQIQAKATYVNGDQVWADGDD